jgi:hypothetical protein
MPINKIAGVYCSLLHSDLYLENKIRTKEMKYDALKSLCSQTKTMSLKQASDLQRMKSSLFEKQTAVEVLRNEMDVIEQDLFNLLDELHVDAIDYPYLESTFRFRRQTMNQKLLVEKL